MPHLLVPTTRLLAGLTLALALAAACGGRATNDGGGSAASTSGGSQHAAGDGSGARGGNPNSGGASAGGSSAAGGTLGIAWPKECSDPPESGSCQAYFQRFYLDIATGICTPFVYGGCGGNDNNYESRQACQDACASTNPSYDHCEVAADCTIGGPGCCGACDGPDVTEHALIAYAKRYTMDVTRPCSGVTCGACPEPTAAGGQLKYFVPDCVNQQCTVTDIRRSQVTACTNDQDCSLRYGTQCCPSCDHSQRVAISNYELLAELVCDAQSSNCPESYCVADVSGATAICEAGHCAVKLVTLD